MSTYVAVALPSVTRWRARADDLAYQLLDAALTARIHVTLGQPTEARDELERALDALAQLDAALPTPVPAAPAAGPRQMEEPYP